MKNPFPLNPVWENALPTDLKPVLFSHEIGQYIANIENDGPVRQMLLRQAQWTLDGTGDWSGADTFALLRAIANLPIVKSALDASGITGHFKFLSEIDRYALAALAGVQDAPKEGDCE